MSASTYVGTSKGARLPWGDVLLSAIAAVSWALIGMAGTAALGLHLLEADSASSLGPMTAAVVALGAGGSVTPSGDVSAFGLTGAEAATAIEIAPLGVSLVGAVLLSWFFLRSLRGAGVVIAPAELLARAGTVVALFVATLGGLAWAGHDVITIDGSSLGLDDLPGGGGGGGLEIPGVGDIGGLLPDQVGDLIDAKAAVGFTVDTAPTLLGGLAWSAGVLLIALLASRRTPLPRAWDAAHRVVRPAVSALVTVLLMAVVAGLAAAAYAAIGDDHPKRIAGAALLGAPNGVWLGIPIGLFVPFDGRASGVLVGLLPDPLDDLLNSDADQSVTLSRLADLDSRVWLLGVAAAVMMLLAGVLTAARTPVVSGAGAGAMAGSGGGVVTGAGAGSAGGSGAGSVRGAGDHGDVRDPGTLRFAGRCALRLGVVTALALPLLAWLAEVSVDASLSVLGFDAFGAGVELRGNLGMALVLGAVWGAGVGAVGALLARATGAAGQRAAPLALGAAGTADRGSDAGTAAGAPGAAGHAGRSGPYAPGAPYRPPNPDTNPYLRVPDEMREPEDARPPHADGVPEGSPPDRGDDMYGAPTVMRPFTPPPRSPRTPRRRENGSSSSGTGDGPPPPPPPPPAPPPRKPKGRP
ncbi:streptophobe family protein [Streptomyces chartreusis]|uniref:streptophobe family protein n=1 Tax=Streptomyces chartreusis TaxID=1969 RepID=UPI002E19370E